MLLTGVVLLLVVAQGILLDVYILINDHTAIANYFWLIPDFLLVFAFVAAMSSGYRSCQRERASREGSLGGCNRVSHIDMIQVQIFGQYTMPIYVWIAYSCLLVAKVAIIFKSEIPNKIDRNDALSPQFLKVILSLTCIIFATLVEGQCLAQSNSLREKYIKYFSHGTAVEILDTVTFLSLLIQSESFLVLPLYLENAIIAFSCINLFFPTIALIVLSRSEYGHDTVCIISSVTYKMCHLWLTNFTYFIIRIYLWAGLSVSVSPFVIKNVYHMFSTMKSVWADIKQLRVVMGDYFDKRRRVYNAAEASGGISLNAGSASNDWTSTSDKFEEIDLKNDVSGNQ